MAVHDSDPYEHGEGENYFVSMTDMMVGMLFIFIILLMSFALLFRQQTDDQSANADEIKKRLNELATEVSERIAAIDAARSLRGLLLQELKAALEAAGLDVEIDMQSQALRLTDKTITFDFGDSVLVGDSLANVKTVARVLASTIPRYLSCKDANRPPACREASSGSIDTLFLEGHTDAQGEENESGRKENWRLSTERAVETFSEITSTNPELDQLTNEKEQRVLSVSAYASSRPAYQGDDELTYARNRRIDLRILMTDDGTTGLKEVQALVENMKVEIEKLTSSTP